MKIFPIPENLFSVEGKRIEKVLQQAVNEALLIHKHAGNSVAIWKNNKIEVIPPEEIFVEI